MMIVIVKTIYILVILPILMGIAIRRLQHVEADVIDSYGLGMLSLMGLYQVIGLALLPRGIAVSTFADYVLKISVVLGVAVLVITIIPGEYSLTGIGKKSALKVKSYTQRGSVTVWSALIVVAAIGMLIVSILFIRSDLNDNVPEVVRMMLHTDGFYTHDPYTGVAYDAPLLPRSAIEAYYATLAAACGITDAYHFMHLIMGAALIATGYSVYITLGRRLLPDKDGVSRTPARLVYFAAVIALYTLELFHAGAIQFEFYQNLWYGQTLITCVVLPAVFSECLAVKRDSVRAVISLPLVMAAAWLCYPHGVWYAAIAAIVIIDTTVILTNMKDKK